MNYNFYDKIIVFFSGGKDSIACVLNLFDCGVKPEQIELWHHNIDGEGPKFMDWECTPAYCKAFADAFNLTIYFSWKVGGFEREMTRLNAKTAPSSFEMPDGSIKTVGGTGGKESTRLKFPQVSPDLSVRWCSAYLKIDIAAIAICNQDRFKGIKTLCLSGERGEESTARANYADLEPYRADLRNGKKFQRYIDHGRPVKNWTEKQVWEIIERYRVRVHPCYYMGWGRCSCMFCIFGNANQFASAFEVSPERGQNIENYEDSFGTTIKRNMSISELRALGTPYPGITRELAAIAMSKTYDLQIIFNNAETWELPAGAYGESCGPI